MAEGGNLPELQRDASQVSQSQLEPQATPPQTASADARAPQEASYPYGEPQDAARQQQQNANGQAQAARNASLPAGGEQGENAEANQANAAAATGSPPLQSLTAAPDVMPQMLSSDARRVGLQKEDEELLDNSSGY